jgi:hypothetical protein
MVIAIPGIVLAAEAAAAAIAAAAPYVAATVAGIASGVVINEIINDVTANRKAKDVAIPACQECAKKKDCPPCVPPVGQRAFQVDSGHSHFPCFLPKSHVHIYVRYQQPAFAKGPRAKPCECGWKKTEPPICLDPGRTYIPRPGEIPYPG